MGTTGTHGSCRSVLIAAFAVAALSACVHTPPTGQDFATSQAAAHPASDEAAAKAIKTYFANSLPGADSAQYAFNGLAQGATVRGVEFTGLSDVHDAGWFMCGTVSTGNGPGTYGRARPFYAYFDPAAPDKVRTAVVENGDYEIVTAWCRDIYGTNFLPQYE